MTRCLLGTHLAGSERRGCPSFWYAHNLAVWITVLYIGGDQVWDFDKGEHIYD